MHNLRHLTVVTLSNTALVYIIVLFEQLLQILIGVHIVLFQTKNIKCLLFCHKPSFYAQSLFSNLFAALIREFLTHGLLPLFKDVFEDFFLAFFNRQRAYHGLSSKLFGIIFFQWIDHLNDALLSQLVCTASFVLSLDWRIISFFILIQHALVFLKFVVGLWVTWWWSLYLLDWFQNFLLVDTYLLNSLRSTHALFLARRCPWPHVYFDSGPLRSFWSVRSYLRRILFTFLKDAFRFSWNLEKRLLMLERQVAVFALLTAVAFEVLILFLWLLIDYYVLTTSWSRVVTIWGVSSTWWCCGNTR